MISQKLKRAVIDEFYKAPFDEMWPGLLFPAIADFDIDQIQEAVEVLLVEGTLVSATHEFTNEPLIAHAERAAAWEKQRDALVSATHRAASAVGLTLRWKPGTGFSLAGPSGTLIAQAPLWRLAEIVLETDGDPKGCSKAR